MHGEGQRLWRWPGDGVDVRQRRHGGFGLPGCGGSAGTPSSSAGPGAGGMGGSVGSNGFTGGGGGAGYYGGGGGGGGTAFDTGGGGGGGSDFCASLSSPLSLNSCAVTGQTSFFGASVTISYIGPSDLASTLVSDSSGLGPGKALTKKAMGIEAAVNAGDTAIACAGVTDYLGLVHAQTGKKLSTDQATLLTTDANNLATALGC